MAKSAFLAYQGLVSEVKAFATEAEAKEFAKTQNAEQTGFGEGWEWQTVPIKTK